MSTTPPSWRAAADRLRRAHLDKQPCAPVRDLIEPNDVVAAYGVQHMLNEARVADGARPVGRKVGLTSPAVQKQLGVNRPDFGVLFDEMSFGSGAVLRANSLLQPRAEAEVAFLLGDDLEEGPLDRHQVVAAVSGVCAGIEIVDSRIADWDITFADTVADNGSSGLFVVAEDWRPLDDVVPVEVQMAMEVNGEITSSGDGSACLGDPLNALIWLAQTGRDLGSPLRAGDVVLSGALGPMVPVRAGDRVLATLSGLGDVSCSFG